MRALRQERWYASARLAAARRCTANLVVLLCPQAAKQLLEDAKAAGMTNGLGPAPRAPPAAMSMAAGSAPPLAPASSPLDAFGDLGLSFPAKPHASPSHSSPAPAAPAVQKEVNLLDMDGDPDIVF